jgi:hypothetical protein
VRIHLDEDASSSLLLKLLRAAGHDVTDTVSLGMRGENDPVQFATAIANARVILSYNADDFQELHDLVGASGGHHPGIIVIYKDNDSARDLSARGIVNAIRKLKQSGAPIENQYITLNQWR